MGREVELKIPLTESEYDFIFRVLHKKERVAELEFVDGECGRIIKSDEYYSRYASKEESRAAGEPEVIRIRGEMRDGAEQFFFCMKRKSVVNGIEMNREDETFVSNPSVIRDVLELAGYHKFFEKKKDVFSAFLRFADGKPPVFHAELELLGGLRYFEVEVTDCGIGADEASAALEHFVMIFGLDPARRDGRSAMEILGAKWK